MRNRFNTRETLNIGVGGAGDVGRTIINVSKTGDTAKTGAAEPLAAIAGILNGVSPDKLSQSAKITHSAREFV